MERLGITAILICFLLVLTNCSVPVSPTPSEPPSTPPPSEPLPPPPPPKPLPPKFAIPESTELITRNYDWQYGGKEWKWELQIPQALYDDYKGIPRPPTANYSVYVTHPLDDTSMNNLVKMIERVAEKEGFSELEKVEFATTFVQSLPYTSDSVTTSYDEYPRYPIETLVDNGGDCEDTSILLASLVNTIGYGVILIAYPGSHCAVGVKGGEGIHRTYFKYKEGKYFYVETTNTGWGIGAIPKEYAGVKAKIYDMTPTPILIHTWKARGEGTTVDLEVTVENLGSAAAHNVYAFVGFDAGGGKLWNPQESKTFTLSVDQSITVKFSLRAPLEKHTRLVIQIIYGSYAVDESYSKWFDT